MDGARAQAYAAATNDAAFGPEGALVPPLFVVVPAWETLMGAVVDVVPPEHLSRLLHLEHDLHFHRPLRAGDELVSETEVHAIRSRRSGAALTLLVRTGDVDGAAVVDQYATMFIRGLGGGESGGTDPPEHVFPSAGRGEPVAEVTAHVDADQTWRYRDASGDTNPIHVDEVYAKEAGLPGIIVHGLCTMAFCGQAVIGGVAGGDAGRLRRLAVRFSRPVRPDTDLLTTVWDLGPAGDRHLYGFEARSEGAVVVKDGRAELGLPGA
ncbi:MAG TPA: MaoC/PaaZ C-terminal domain-containing protein [Acidimicrobiales bacterium]|nr:MaoC/PaaZ C-terminal domain-containing protein [Acidimicrobiales bacterium]